MTVVLFGKEYKSTLCILSKQNKLVFYAKSIKFSKVYLTKHFRFKNTKICMNIHFNIYKSIIS